MMISDDVRREALREFTLAYRCQRSGELGQAIFHYRRSIELIPTAEAYTFLGWAYSFQGRLEEAIQECKKAVALDPTLGNPYNDIGAYLIELGRPEDALAWLARALKAVRYENYSYPYYNLGRAHEMLGHREEAHSRYQNSIDEDPAFTPALIALKRIQDLPADTSED
ncbi:tetratricopeptide repeat protein [Gemmatimonadota bacterium]